MGFSLPRLAILKPAPLRKRLWQVAIALVAVVGTFTIGNFFVSPDKAVSSNMLGHDFLAFYTGGTFARTGQFDKLYDLDAARESEHAIAAANNLEIGKSFGPYWNPPFYAWLLAPYTLLPYRQALAAWTCTNLACLMIAIVMLVRMLPGTIRQQTNSGAKILVVPQPKRHWQDWALVPLLVVCSMPFIQAISHGQNTFMSLMLLTLVVTAWRKNMPITAGLVCGCMLYKPQLAAVVAVMLVLTMGVRVLLGIGFVGGTLLLITARTMPDAIGNFLTQLPQNLKYMQVDHDYLWERHATLKAFWRLLFQGRSAGEASPLVNLLTIASCGLIGFGLLGAWWKSKKIQLHEEASISRDRLIVATIISMPLLMPFYFDYDLLLLSVPAVLIAGERISRPASASPERMERLFIGIWFAFCGWLMLNPPIAGLSCVNVTVVLLSTLCGLSIARACRFDPAGQSVFLHSEAKQPISTLKAA